MILLNNAVIHFLSLARRCDKSIDASFFVQYEIYFARLFSDYLHSRYALVQITEKKDSQNKSHIALREMR